VNSIARLQNINYFFFFFFRKTEKEKEKCLAAVDLTVTAAATANAERGALTWEYQRRSIPLMCLSLLDLHRPRCTLRSRR
ncbi:hypothetical protein, partial [Latilactobacillus sakei]|uniref:hypothetical protein n=1 Tax=Latilactobacillus sakei TaxID=1599 RepID=UPI003F532700